MPEHSNLQGVAVADFALWHPRRHKGQIAGQFVLQAALRLNKPPRRAGDGHSYPYLLRPPPLLRNLLREGVHKCSAQLQRPKSTSSRKSALFISFQDMPRDDQPFPLSHPRVQRCRMCQGQNRFMSLENGDEWIGGQRSELKSAPFSVKRHQSASVWVPPRLTRLPTLAGHSIQFLRISARRRGHRLKRSHCASVPSRLAVPVPL